MKILLTNDDGIFAEGLKVLKDVLSVNHQVYVVAPDRNRSCVSHGFLMGKKLKLVEHEKNVYSSEGLPADCTITGLLSDFIPQVDLVISGINNDSNLGTDILYSGTCAGARQACLFGVPGIAVSISPNPDDSKKQNQYNVLAGFVEKNLRTLITLCGKRYISGGENYYENFVNINAMSLEKYRGVKITSVADRNYGDSIRVEKDKDGNVYTCICGGKVESSGSEDADAFAVAGGYISVCAVKVKPHFYTEEYKALEDQFIVG